MITVSDVILLNEIFDLLDQENNKLSDKDTSKLNCINAKEYRDILDKYKKESNYWMDKAKAKDAKIEELELYRANYESLKEEYDSLEDDYEALIDTNNYIPNKPAPYDHISWDEYFMAVAQIVKSRSKDPNTKVGACIVKNNRIISTGYNGFPTGCNDNEYPWSKGDSDETKNKYFYVTHAELNAILNARQSVEGSTVYVTLFPCNECAKAIIQSGIKHVIYKELNISTVEKCRKHSAILRMFEDAGVTIDEYTPSNKIIEIEV